MTNFALGHYFNVIFYENNAKKMFWYNFKGYFLRIFSPPHLPESQIYVIFGLFYPKTDPKKDKKTIIETFSKYISFFQYIDTKFIQIRQKIRKLCFFSFFFFFLVFFQKYLFFRRKKTASEKKSKKITETLFFIRFG